MATHTTTGPATATNPFTKLAQRLTAWRGARPRGQKIPEDLWREAVELARAHGLSPTTTALQLNYYDLQRRVGAGRARRKRSAPQPAFVELSAPSLPAPRCDPGTLELIRPCGTRLLLRLPEASPKDLVPLVGLLLKHRA
jgi:hypothetical protein